ncbi:carbohydrate sulfotransferase 11-like [Gordionus sp. m RMFG-2023]|uniref:carbohydrate sulfotransferase 11-like n=1 Tax=Gordionus sp. m RMFG-2023 TaxID=3053472 RepID=UPI0031FD8E1A
MPQDFDNIYLGPSLSSGSLLFLFFFKKKIDLIKCLRKLNPYDYSSNIPNSELQYFEYLKTKYNVSGYNPDGSLLNLSEETLGIARIGWLKHVCSAISPLYSVMNDYALSHKIVDEARGVIYCYVPKASSTSWKSFFMVSNNLSYKTLLESSMIPNDSLGHYVEGFEFKILSNLVMSDDNYEARKYLKFMFVRNPISRLMSAYRSKFEWKNEYFISRYRNYIELLASSNSSEIGGQNFDAVFKTGEQSNNNNNNENVTFLKFVKFLLNIRYLRNESLREYLVNEHWRPYSDICAPCSRGLDFIGKQESLVQDVKKILGLTGWDTLNYNPFKQYFPFNLGDAHSRTLIDMFRSKTISRDYSDHESVLLESLPEDLLVSLIGFYKYDYLLFYPLDPLFRKYINRLA